MIWLQGFALGYIIGMGTMFAGLLWAASRNEDEP